MDADKLKRVQHRATETPGAQASVLPGGLRELSLISWERDGCKGDL